MYPTAVVLMFFVKLSFFSVNYFWKRPFFLVKHRMRKPEVVYGQLEGCNRNFRPKTALANVFMGLPGHLYRTRTVYTVCANNNLFEHMYMLTVKHAEQHQTHYENQFTHHALGF